MKHLLKLFAATVALSLTAGCAPNISSNADIAANANQVSNIVPGKLISIRAVQLASNSGVGTLAGAVAGGAAGSAIGSGTRTNIIGAVGGALVGGMLGNAAEGALSKQTGYQYIVQTNKGGMVSITQGLDPSIAIGSCVLVMYSAKATVITDPQNLCLNVTKPKKKKA